MRVKRILRCISANNCTIFLSCFAGIVDFYVWWWFSGGMGILLFVLGIFALGLTIKAIAHFSE